MASSRGGSEHSRRSSFRWRETTPFPVVKLTLRAGHRAPNRTRPVAVDEQQIEPRLVAGVSCTRRARPLPPSRRVPDELHHCRVIHAVLSVLRDDRPYTDPDIDYEKLIVERNAPRWLRMLTRHGFLAEAQAAARG